MKHCTWTTTQQTQPFTPGGESHVHQDRYSVERKEVCGAWNTARLSGLGHSGDWLRRFAHVVRSPTPQGNCASSNQVRFSSFRHERRPQTGTVEHCSDTKQNHTLHSHCFLAARAHRLSHPPCTSASSWRSCGWGDGACRTAQLHSTEVEYRSSAATRSEHNDTLGDLDFFRTLLAFASVIDGATGKEVSAGLWDKRNLSDCVRECAVAETQCRVLSGKLEQELR